jgi:DNA-binding PadR family transcriptional regulator
VARPNLGEFEHLILLAIMRLGDDAYGVSIRREIEQRTGRSVSLGAIYPALDRLEIKGLISSEIGEPTPMRGGRAKRHLHLTPDGRDMLLRTRSILLSFWEGFEPSSGMGVSP